MKSTVAVSIALLLVGVLISVYQPAVA